MDNGSLENETNIQTTRHEVMCIDESQKNKERVTGSFTHRVLGIDQMYLLLFISFPQEPDKAFVLKQQRWAACMGSQGHYRGYPCSLWTLFHALTVNAEQLGERKLMQCRWHVCSVF